MTDKNFSISLWFNVKDVPKALTDNNRCEYFLFGRPDITWDYQLHMKVC